MSERGTLFVVGGAEVHERDPVVLDAFARLCGGPSARLLVLSAASSQPERKKREYEDAFAALGVRRVSVRHQERREDAEAPDLLRAAARADGVFFSGGGQLKLVTTLAGTSLDALLRSRHRDGLTLGGTSAGAAAMSAVMIARGQGRSSARLASVRLAPGLGFLPNVIVDQHFRERDRFGRLLAAVLCNPAMLGFGVDEDTAFALDRFDRVSVLGKGTVTIADGSELVGSDVHRVPEERLAAFAGMRVHVLSEGWTFDLAKRRVGLPLEERM